MAELTTADRLQPSLLDRLRDDEPRNQQEGRDRRIMSMRQLRDAVLRDLVWLLNAASPPSWDEVNEFPLVAKSVLNYGMPDMTGRTAGNVSRSELERAVRTSVFNFEPRVMHDTLKVKAVKLKRAERESENAIGFEISGDLCPLPMPEALFVRTSLDLETGRCTLRNAGARG